MRFLTVSLLLTAALIAPAAALEVSDREAQAAGDRIWRNECGHRVDGLTSWNHGEDFASLGIGHFIWYPEGRPGPFDEGFPKLLAYLKEHKVKLPDWLAAAKACPWSSREAFEADFHGAHMTELRELLANTVAWQARFAVHRLEGTLPLMLEAAPESERATIRERFNEIASAPGGVYPLVDYVNFKGEGVKLTERYAGKGWGLLQVLESMPPGHATLHAFADAADRVLTERVRNSPPARRESQWLPGWRNRVHTYG